MRVCVRACVCLVEVRVCVLCDCLCVYILSVFACVYVLQRFLHVERRDSGVELRTLDYENPGSNHVCGVKTLGKCFQSALLQFTQLNKLVPRYRQWWKCIRAVFAH